MKSVRAADFAAGFSVAWLMLPEAVAYSAIAGLPPFRALVSAVVGGIAYSLLGQSRFAIVAPTSSSAALLAAALATLPLSVADRYAAATAVVAIVGLLFGMMALFRLGGLSAFISRPVLKGFAFGIALSIATRQLPSIFGLGTMGSSVGAELAGIYRHLDQIQPLSLLLGGVTLAALLVSRRWPRFPAMMVIMMAGIGLSWLFDLAAHGVATVGIVEFGIIKIALPHLSFEGWSRLFQWALPIGLILFSESWGTIRSIGLRVNETVAPDRELRAIAGANICAALVQGMPVGAGFSAGSAAEAAGSRSKATAVVAACTLAAVMLCARPAVALIPIPMLAAVVIAALAHALEPGPIRQLFRLNRDQWIAVAAALAVIFLGVLDGMLVAIGLSLAALLRRLGRPTVSLLGQLHDSHDFVDIDRHKEARTIGDIAIFRPNAPLFFANAEGVFTEIDHRLAAMEQVRHVILSLEESDDLDSTAVDALSEFSRKLRSTGVDLSLARAHDRVRDLLETTELARLARSASFSVADAYASATRQPR